MTYLTINYLHGKEAVGKSIQRTCYAEQKETLHDWLKEFNPCGKIHNYALAAFNEGLCFDDVVIECQNAFNDINIEKIKSIVVMVYNKYKSAKLN